MNISTLHQELRRYGTQFNPPCTSKQLQQLEVALQTSLPIEIVSIYAFSNGATTGGSVPFRLLSIEEVSDTHQAFEKISFPSTDFRAFWTDDNSNYACLYISGKLQGMVCFLDHEEPDIAPRYHSLNTFYLQLLEGAQLGITWNEMKTDFPMMTESENEAQIALLAQAFIQEYQETSDEDRQVYLATCAINLTHPSLAHTLLLFLQAENMWVQEKACQYFGAINYVPAIPLLANIAQTGTHNGQIAAITALGFIPHPEARNELISIRKGIDEAMKIYLAGALKNQGYQTKREETIWYYRENAEKQWDTL